MKYQTIIDNTKWAAFEPSPNCLYKSSEQLRKLLTDYFDLTLAVEQRWSIGQSIEWASFPNYGPLDSMPQVTNVILTAFFELQPLSEENNELYLNRLVDIVSSIHQGQEYPDCVDNANNALAYFEQYRSELEKWKEYTHHPSNEWVKNIFEVLDPED